MSETDAARKGEREREKKEVDEQEIYRRTIRSNRKGQGITEENVTTQAEERERESAREPSESETEETAIEWERYEVHQG